MRQGVRRTSVPGGEPHTGFRPEGCGLSCSIGGAVCPRDGRDYDSLLMKADIAVHEAKRREKNQFCFTSPE